MERRIILLMPMRQRSTILQFSGEDWREWLQGQITQDIRILNNIHRYIDFCMCKPTGQMLTFGTLNVDGQMVIPTSTVQSVLDRVEQMVIMEDCLVESMGEENVNVDEFRPVWGIDMTASNFPAEMGEQFEQAVISYTKGCYTGQEINHRIHARGHTNKTWQWLVAEKYYEPGSTLTDLEGNNVGTVTRVLELDGKLLIAAFVKNGAQLIQVPFKP